MAHTIARSVLAVFALAGTVGVEAACDPQASLVFSCATAQGNVVELCEEGAMVRYSFGVPGMAPQLAITLPRSELQLSPLRAFGKVESYALTIPYREATHVIYWSLDDPGDEPEAGVRVFVEGAPRAVMQCVPGQIRNNLSKGGFLGGGG